LQGEVARNREDAAHLAIAAARAIADVALDAHGHERVAAAVEAALSSLHSTPRVVVTTAPAHVEQLKEQLDQAAPHLQGRIVVREKPDAAPGDARIDWGEGAIEIDRAAIIEDIEARVRRALTEGAAS
jgi:flagellar assembly protein FliH